VKRLWLKGKFFLSGEIVEACVEFDTQIRNIRNNCKPDLETPNDTIVVPGAVDMHVHVRGMEMAYKEDVTSATKEATYGGLTLIVDMPNTSPYVRDEKTIKEKLSEFEYYSRCNYGIYSGVPNEGENVEDMPIAGYKIFPEDLWKKETENILKNSRKLKILHPEVPLYLFRGTRLSWMELASLYMVSGGKRVHITHATTLDTIAISKKMGFTVDMTPHHMIVDGERNCLSKVNPPIRDITERNKLIQEIHEVDALVSDHAPHAKWEKNMPYEVCPPGIAGLSFTVPFVFSLSFKGIISLGRAVQLVSTNPSKILGIKYGEIANEYPANFTVIKRENWRYRTVFSKTTYTPMDGYPLDARVYMTIVRGKVAFLDGEPLPVKGANVFDKNS
jgi:dihydroorotase